MWAHGGRLIFMVMGLVLASCKHHADADAPVARSKTPKPTASAPPDLPTQERTLQGDAFRYCFAIYLQSTPKLDLNHELATAVTGTGLRVVAQRPTFEPPPTTTSVFLSQPKLEEFAPPKPDSLEYRAKDLSREEQQQLLQSRFVAVFDVIGPGRRALADYRQALVLAQTLATKLGGILWDEETRHAHSLKSWQSRVTSWQGELPQLTQHVTIDIYRDGELMRLVSLGMVKFGLPDLAINQVSSSDGSSMGSLMNVAMQRMVERRALDEPGMLHLSLDDVAHAAAKQELGGDTLANAQRKLKVTLTKVAPAEGDADNRLFELDFPGPGSAQERQARAIATLFGSSDSITHIEHDAALLEASVRARKTAFGFRARYAKAPPLGERLLVKAPFPTPSGGNEWMWVEVVSWKGKLISGILDNDPFEIPTLKAGARVEVQADRIFDYVLIKPDGTREGNETGRLIEAREQQR